MLVLAADAERGFAVRCRERLLIGLRDEVNAPRGEHRGERRVKRGPRDVRQALAELPQLDELALGLA